MKKKITMKLYQKIKNSLLIKQFVKTGISGFFALIVDYSALNILIIFVHLPLLYANTASAFLGFITSFILNTKWSFKERFTTEIFVKFLLANILGIALNDLIVFSLSEKIGIYYNFSKLAAIFIVFFYNFSVYKFWVFRSDSNKAKAM